MILLLKLLMDILSGTFPFFALHLSDSGSFPPPLDKSEESECLMKIKEGNAQARDRLIEHNLRLVAHIVKKFNSPYSEQDDLISVGTIGLIKAVNSFDINKNIRFATYASKCIENEILMYFRQQKKSSQDFSINDPIETDSEGNPITLMEIVKVDDTIADDIDLEIKIEKLKKCIAQLKDEREKTIIVLRYGMNGAKPLTQKETAKLLGISRSYVSRIEKKTLAELRRMIDSTD